MLSSQRLVPRRTFLQGIGAGVALQAFGQTRSEPNSEPNPYKKIATDWAHLPGNIHDGKWWGQVVGLDVDKDGNIWAFNRSHPLQAQVNVDTPAMFKFSPTGDLLASWGTGMFALAHNMFIDRQGFIWTVDAEGKDGVGAQVLKFDPSGKVVMSLGTKGLQKEGANGESFASPTGVVVASNGDIFVTDGHRGPAGHRIVKYARDGKFVKTWGKMGSEPGNFRTPHAIAIDSQDRVFVADRGNKRVQVFDPDGTFVAEWPQFGICEVLYIAKGDVLYVSDANSTAETKSPYKKGIRVGSAKDGSIKYFIPEEVADDPGGGPTKGPVSLCADATGSTIYACDVGTAVGFDKMMKKYVKG
jgi:hypothetical protein